MYLEIVMSVCTSFAVYLEIYAIVMSVCISFAMYLEIVLSVCTSFALYLEINYKLFIVIYVCVLQCS